MTPPPELVQEWLDTLFKDSGLGVDPHKLSTGLAARAAQWGADQELEACCAVLDGLAYDEAINSTQLRMARRPKRINLRRVALLQLEQLDAGRAGDVIRQALEQLPDD